MITALIVIFAIATGGQTGPRPIYQDNSMCIERSISGDAQLKTIAFDALAFMTGDMGSCTFFPPGKVSDLFGFQYLRDNDTDSRGHSGEFLSRCADNVLHLLHDSQITMLEELAHEQVDQINEFAFKRMQVISVYRRLLEDSMPEGSTSLDTTMINEAMEELYRLDGIMCIRRAEVLGEIIRSLDPVQLDYLNEMALQGMESWPEVIPGIDSRSIPRDQHVAIMTYASQLFSWYTGSIESDIYFCPERHGTYFGAFYLKDMPAMADPGYNIGENLTADTGSDFLELLDYRQKMLIENLVVDQVPSIQRIVEIRENLAQELRMALEGEPLDSEEIMRLATEYGSIDGRISIMYAITFTEIYRSLSSQQIESIRAIAQDLGYEPCQGAFLYSEPIPMPFLENTDRFFR